MKGSKFSIIFCCIFVFTNAYIFAQPKSDLQIENILGKVKSITSSYSSEAQHYTDSYSTTRKKYKSVTVDYYDTSGNLITSKSSSKKDTLLKRFVFELDKNNRKIKCTSYNTYDSADVLYTFKYDIQGFIVQQNSYSIHGSGFSKVFISYTPDGFIAEEKFFNQLNNLIKRKVYSYTNNNISEVDEYYSDNATPIKYFYTYDNFDAAGNWQVKREDALNSFTTTVTIRKIEYYK